MKTCDRGLETAAFSSPRSLFFTIWTDRKPANNVFIFSLCYIGLQVVPARTKTELVSH